MFDILPASDAHPLVRGRWLTTSLLSHALVIAIAVMVTRQALQAARAPVPEQVTPLYFPPPTPTPPAAPETRSLEGIRPLLPPRVIPPLGELPPAIPPVDLSRRPFDPRDFTGNGRENGVTDAVPSTGIDRGVYQANSALEGFHPAVLLSQPTPRYPAALQAAGVAGSIVVEFVIDTAGRVERGSVRIVESSQREFEDAARGAVLGARFRPAHLAGRPVRQITRQRVRFVSSASSRLPGVVPRAVDPIRDLSG